MTAYIIKSSVSLLLMFGLYWFLLRKEKLFVFNRFFLILSIAFSLVLPLITIPVNLQIAPQLNEIIPSYNYAAPEVIVADNIVPRDLNISQSYVEKEKALINIFTILLVLYISGVILFLIRFLRNIYLILRRSKLSEKISSKGYRIVLTDDKSGPCCFFSNIFLNKDDYLNGKIDKELLNHELEHVRQSHTIDIILIEVVKIFYWFNPINLLYERAIRINHEYLADNGVINENSDIKSYTDKLLNFISCSSNMSLTSGSNNSFTKLRLMMMMKSRSSSFIYGARIAVTFCMGAVVFLLLSFKESKQQLSQTDPTQTEIEIQQSSIKGIIKNEDGEPLVGVSIGNTGTMGNAAMKFSGSDGRFVLYNIEPDAYLSFALRGYKSQSAKADFKSEMIIKMIKDPEYKEPNYENAPKEKSTPPIPLTVLDGVVTKEPAAVINSKLGPELGTIINLTGKEATDKYGEAGKNGVTEIYTRKKAAELGIKIPFRRNGPDDYPTFQGANYTTFNDWVVSQIRYPSDASNKGVQGRVTVYYTVETDGTVSKVSLMGKPDPLIGGAAIKAVQSSPKWEPAKNPEAKDPYSSMVAIRYELPDKIFKDDTYVMSEKRPQYPGGDAELINFIKANTKYPEALKPEKIEGRVAVRFVVNKNGNVEDLTILKGIHPLLDAEAIRVISLLKGFSPGTQGGNPVNVYYAAIVNFSLPEPEPLFKKTSETAFLKFLGTNIKYPQEAKASSDTGTIYAVVKLEKGGSIKECKTFTEKSGINVPILPEIVIVGYKSSIEPGDLRPGEKTGKAPRIGLNELQTECLRVTNMLSVNEIPDWKDKNMEFAITFKFVLK
jgi:TonB family protein